MSVEAIVADWDKRRDLGRSDGMKFHLDCEHFLNGNEVDNDSLEFSYFRKFMKEKTNLKPYRTE